MDGGWWHGAEKLPRGWMNPTVVVGSEAALSAHQGRSQNAQGGGERTVIP